VKAASQASSSMPVALTSLKRSIGLSTSMCLSTRILKIFHREQRNHHNIAQHVARYTPSPECGSLQARIPEVRNSKEKESIAAPHCHRSPTRVWKLSLQYSYTSKNSSICYSYPQLEALLYEPKLILTSLQLRCRRCSSPKKHRCLQNDRLDRPNLPRTLWSQ
jgi:hypothetical protein